MCVLVFVVRYRFPLSGLLKRACYFAKSERIAIVDRRRLIRLQALAVDARGVGAVEVGQGVGAADVLKSGVNTRDSLGPLHAGKIDLWIDAAQVVVGTSHCGTFTDEPDLLAVTESQVAPGGLGVKDRFA